jgi:hypothetical protein
MNITVSCVRLTLLIAQLFGVHLDASAKGLVQPQTLRGIQRLYAADGHAVVAKAPFKSMWVKVGTTLDLINVAAQLDRSKSNGIAVAGAPGMGTKDSSE